MKDIRAEKMLRVQHQQSVEFQRRANRAAAERNRIATELRGQGYTLAAIAELLGVNRQRVLQYTGAKKKPAETEQTDG